MKVVIAGSFRTSLEDIDAAISRFRAQGHDILAPQTTQAKNPDDAFVFLATDAPEKSPRQLEMEFMDAVRQADLLHVVVHGGYIGHSASAEMAVAALHKIPIQLSGPIEQMSDRVPPEMLALIHEYLNNQVKTFNPEDTQILQTFIDNLLETL